MIALVVLALAVQESDSSVMLEAAVDSAPVVQSGPRLIYPLDLLRNGKQGLVLVQFILDTTGRVERNSIRVIATPHMGFNLAAKEYVAGAVFFPGIFHGRKVRTLVQFPVVFRIRGARP
jgi:TonB family protein